VQKATPGLARHMQESRKNFSQVNCLSSTVLVLTEKGAAKSRSTPCSVQLLGCVAVANNKNKTKQNAPILRMIPSLLISTVRKRLPL